VCDAEGHVVLLVLQLRVHAREQIHAITDHEQVCFMGTRDSQTAQMRKDASLSCHVIIFDTSTALTQTRRPTISCTTYPSTTFSTTHDIRNCHPLHVSKCFPYCLSASVALAHAHTAQSPLRSYATTTAV
jgi:hypothetical protein